MLKRALTSLAEYLFVTVALAQNFPLWERLLSHYGGKSDKTSVPSMKMGGHMLRWPGYSPERHESRLRLWDFLCQIIITWSH
jgi:hypothetical protein